MTKKGRVTQYGPRGALGLEPASLQDALLILEKLKGDLAGEWGSRFAVEKLDHALNHLEHRLADYFREPGTVGFDGKGAS